MYFYCLSTFTVVYTAVHSGQLQNFNSILIRYLSSPLNYRRGDHKCRLFFLLFRKLLIMTGKEISFSQLVNVPTSFHHA